MIGAILLLLSGILFTIWLLTAIMKWIIEKDEKEAAEIVNLITKKDNKKAIEVELFPELFPKKITVETKPNKRQR